MEEAADEGEDGIPGADRDQDAFFAAVYQELRLIAHARLRQQRRGTMLDTTALVHEAYLKLAGNDGDLDGFNNQRHFFATAALAMRQILTDQARRRQAEKRGSNQRNLTFDEGMAATEDSSAFILELDSALEQLAELDRELVDIVNLRYFGGLSLDEISEIQGVSRRTVSRAWQKSRAFLHAQMKD